MALRTNSKVVRAAAEDEFVSRLRVEAPEGSVLIKEGLEALLKDFLRYYRTNRLSNYQDAFHQYLMILPSTFNTPAATQDMREWLQKTLEQSEAEANKYSDTQVENLYCYLMYASFQKLWKVFFGSEMVYY